MPKEISEIKSHRPRLPKTAFRTLDNILMITEVFTMCAFSTIASQLKE